MEKLRFRFTKAAGALLLAMLVIPYFSSCKDDEKVTPKSSEKEMSGVSISAGGSTFYAELQSDGKTFKFLVPLVSGGQLFDQNALKTATVDFTLSKEATSEPAPGQSADLTDRKSVV